MSVAKLFRRFLPGFEQERARTSSDLSGAGNASGEVPERPPEWSLVTKYSIGPVTYFIYRGGDGVPRLAIKEPEPPDEHVLVDMAAGIRKPKNEEERYLMDKYSSGYGKLYPLIIDPHVEEISYTGKSPFVAVLHKLAPSRWMLTNVKLTKQEADGLAIELARKANKTLSVATPYIEGLTVEGHRISVSFMDEITRFGSTFVIRKYPQKPLTIADLLSLGAITPLMAAYLWIILEAQGFIIISGSMGSGKTTVLQALLSLLPPYVKVVTIEDTPELVVDGPLWDSFVTRPRLPGQEVEEVSLEDLLRFALRRRADYVVVGEVRGREARLLAQAAASGYGALTTIHADSPAGVITRLTLDPINLPESFIDSIKSIVQLSRLPSLGGKVSRRVSEVAEVISGSAVTIMRWSDRPSPADVADRSYQLRWAADKLGISDVEQELAERAKFLESIVGKSSEEFRVGLVRFYLSRYGDLI